MPILTIFKLSEENLDMRTRYAKVALTLALFFAIGLGGVNAQTTVQIGGTTTTDYYPIELYYTFSISDAIYTVADLATAGWVCGSGTITSLQLYSSMNPSYGQGGTVRIFMQNTSASNFTNTTQDSTGMTLVWAGSLPTLSPAWINFTLQNAFSYTSGSNLRIQIRRLEPAQYTYYDLHYWGAHTPPASQMHRTGRNDTDLGTIGLSYWATRPSLKLTFSQFCDQPPVIVVTNAGSACAPSAGQTIVSTITDAGGTITESRIWFRKNGGTWYNAAPQTIASSTYTFYINHTTVGGVASGDQIQWYIAAKDNSNNVATLPAGGSGSSTPVGSTPPATFNSYAVPAMAPYFQNFDASNHGWTFGVISTGTSDWRVGAPNATFGAALSGANVLALGPTTGTYTANATCWALSPPFSFVGAPFDPVVIFDTKFQTENSWDPFWFEYTTNLGATWTTLGVVADPNGSNWYTGSAAYSPCLGQAGFIGDYSTTWRHAVRTLTGLAGASCVQFRFRFCSDGSVMYAGAAIDDFKIGYYPQKDIALSAVNVSYATNRWAFVATQNHTVSATIMNNGWESNPTTVTLVYKVGSAPTSAVDGVAETFTPTWAGVSAVCTFATPYTPAATGAATIYVRAFYTGDLGPANDQMTKLITAQTIKTFGYEDFEGLSSAFPTVFSPGFTLQSSGGANTWIAALTGLVPAAGPMVGAWINDGNANDYLISPPALLQAGSSYRVRFKYVSVNIPSTLRLLYGKTANPATMTVLNTWSIPAGTTFIDALGPVPGVAPYFNTDPAAAADYYIAFHVTGTYPVSAASVQIDGIILDENPTPPPKIGWGLPGTAQGQHIDNISTPMQIIAIYKKPGKIMKTYEVVSTTYNYGSPGDFLWDVTTSTSWLKVIKSIANPTQYLPGNPFNPARPRQLQTFSLEIDPTGLQPGTYNGQLIMNGRLYNSQYPSGIGATNEPFPVPVQLIVMDAGSGVPGSANSIRVCRAGLTTSATPYVFADPSNGLPFAAVTVTSGTIPNICIEAFPGQLPQGIARYRYIQRYFNVASGGTGWTANIDWYYTDTEAQMGGVTRPDLLRCIRQLVSGGVWQSPTTGVTSTPYPNLYYVKGAGYNPTNIAGNHCLATNWTPKQGAGTLPTVYMLDQNYPNPFNPATKIDFSVPEEVPVKLTVYNSLGDEVAVLLNETMQAGSYSIPFDASAYPSGTYMYRLSAGSFSDTKRMLLAK